MASFLSGSIHLSARLIQYPAGWINYPAVHALYPADTIDPPSHLDTFNSLLSPSTSALLLPSRIFTQFLGFLYMDLIAYTAQLRHTMSIRRRYCSCIAHRPVL